MVGLIFTLILQSPKGAETFPKQGLVTQPPAVFLSIVNSNAYSKFKLGWTKIDGADGYMVSWGNVSSSKTNMLYTSKTNVVIGGLRQNVMYYFAVVATNKTNASLPSNELSKQLPISFDTVTLTWLPTNSTARIYSSSDLKVWNLVTNTLPPYTKPRNKILEYFKLR